MSHFGVIGKLGILLVFGICVLTGCGVSTETESSIKETNSQNNEVARGTLIGQLAPDFELEKTGGGKISFRELEGNPAVLVFWTAWCPICKEEAPHINRLASEFEPKGVRVVGINIGESDARVAEGIKDFGIKYTVAKDKDTSVAKTYKVIGTPTILFLSRKGKVQYFGNELPKDYSKRLELLIGS